MSAAAGRHLHSLGHTSCITAYHAAAGLPSLSNSRCLSCSNRCRVGCCLCLPPGVDSTTDSEFSSLERDRHSASEAPPPQPSQLANNNSHDVITRKKKAKTRNPESSLPPPPPPPQVHWAPADKWGLRLHDDVDRCKLAPTVAVTCTTHQYRLAHSLQSLIVSRRVYCMASGIRFTQS